MDFLIDAIHRPLMQTYLRILAVVLGIGALLQVADILGFGGTPWGDTPMLWRVMNIVLWAFDVGVGLGLWFRHLWAVIAWVIGTVALQIIPSTIFQNAFAQTPEQASTLTQLAFFEGLLIALLVTLIILKK